jgi:hypothetical protein
LSGEAVEALLTDDVRWEAFAEGVDPKTIDAKTIVKPIRLLNPLKALPPKQESFYDK